jgi:hypothetical protein
MYTKCTRADQLRIVIDSNQLVFQTGDLLLKSIFSISNVFNHRKGRATWPCLILLLL